MGGNHHGTTVSASRPAVWVIVAVIGPVALITFGALIWLWPVGRSADQPADQAAEQGGLQRAKGTIVSIARKPCPAQPPVENAPEGAPQRPDRATCGEATVLLTKGPGAGRSITTALPTGPGPQRYADGDHIVLLYAPGGPAGDPYRISDHDRASPLWVLGAAFALAVVAFGRWRGVTALVGLAITFAVLLMFIIPAILAGQSPLLVAVVGSAAIMLAVLYLTHGFTQSTSVAVIGTLTSLTLTGLLAAVAINAAHLFGIVDESSLYLDMSYSINTQGLLLASIIIGSLGVLDDVTVTQATTVTELAHANPDYNFRQLYRAASRVGRAHIASVINTIILAYAGASLPLLLLVSVGSQPFGDILASPGIAQEIVRSVVGSLGLIAAVPITTTLAALTTSRERISEHGVPSGGPRHRRTTHALAPPQHSV